MKHYLAYVQFLDDVFITMSVAALIQLLKLLFLGINIAANVEQTTI